MVKLTSFSHGAGCGCKLSPAVLEEILNGAFVGPDNVELLVGNNSKDDAAIFELSEDHCVISTTDFFMPIVDDAFDFGRIAAANAISDVYAMGGKPIMALAILGWPIDKLSSEVAQKIIAGGRSICHEAGIALAGGHSIDASEPIFGLAVNGIVHKKNIKRNSTACFGDYIILTKRLGVGILATAEKKGLLLPNDIGVATSQMVQLNKLGMLLCGIDGVHAMTDVTGFGLLGHLLEMVKGSGVGAVIEKDAVLELSGNLAYYIQRGCVSGGLSRNWKSYKNDVLGIGDGSIEQIILSDPQTSGGLLISVDASSLDEVVDKMISCGLEQFTIPIGTIVNNHVGRVLVK